MTTQPEPADNPDSRRRVPKPLPPIEEVMRKEYVHIPDLATLLSTSVEGVRTMLDLGSIPPPLRKVGKRWTWRRADFIDWMDSPDDSERWTPRPYDGPPPPTAA